MGYRFFFILLFLFKSYPLISQETYIPGDSLFPSAMEKQAFEKVNNETCDPLIFLLADDRRIDSTQYQKVKDELISYSDRLAAKRKKMNNEVNFLRYVFNHAHKQYLRNYDYPASFTSIFNNGRYNCVTGAALYACVLNQLGYLPELYETRFHVFLVLRANDGTQVMYETTDSLHGFVSNKEEIANRIKTYLQNEKAQLRSEQTLAPPFHTNPLLNKINLKELAGLHYYNLAVSALNECDSLIARQALLKAKILYPHSERIAHLLEYTNAIMRELKMSHN